MTIEEAEKRVAGVAYIADDDERAHSEEDALHVDILTAIAAGAPNARELAAVGLRTCAIEFARYCA